MQEKYVDEIRELVESIEAKTSLLGEQKKSAEKVRERIREIEDRISELQKVRQKLEGLRAQTEGLEQLRGELEEAQRESSEISTSLEDDRFAARAQKHMVPDLALWDQQNLKSVISIKVYPQSSTDLRGETEKLIHLKAEHPNLRVLLLVYLAPLSKPVQEHLTEIEKNNSWFKHKALHNEHEEKVCDVMSWVLEGFQ